MPVDDATHRMVATPRSIEETFMTPETSARPTALGGLQGRLLAVRHPSTEVRRRGQALLFVLGSFIAATAVMTPWLFAVLPGSATVPGLAIAGTVLLACGAGLLTARAGFVDATGLVVSVVLAACVAAGIALTGLFEPFGWAMTLVVLLAGLALRPAHVPLVFLAAQGGVIWARLATSAEPPEMLLADLDLGFLSLVLAVIATVGAVQGGWQRRFFAEEQETRHALELSRHDAERARDEAERALGETERARAEAEEERVQAEIARDAARRAQQLAEHASQAKSVFLANMSHELRTPLNAIIGYSEMLEEDHDPHADAEVVADLVRIRRAGRHLLALVNDVLDLAKIEAGRMTLELQRFDFAELLRQTIDEVLPSALETGNELHLELADDVGFVHSDPTKLRQIVLNLLSNAVKFTKDGHIHVRSRNGRRTDGIEELVIEVEDTGIGISDDQLQTIFRAFEQADPSTTREYGGTGLGLAVSEKLAKLLEGEITVDSTLGEGSTFTVRVASTHLRVRSQRDVAGRITGLEDTPRLPDFVVIHGNPITREQVVELLATQGFHAQGAESREHGLAWLEAFGPSITTPDSLQ